MASFNDYANTKVIEYVQSEAHQQGHVTFIIDDLASSPLGESRGRSFWERRKTDGVIIVGFDVDLAVQNQVKLIPTDLPVIAVGSGCERDHLVRVCLANFDGARRATEHLYSLGHRWIAHITGPDESRDSIERKEGYLDALRRARIRTDEGLIATGDWSSPGGYRATLELLDGKQRFTALFVQNDLMAMGALRALRERDLAVPRDVAVVGFDDIPSAPFLSPPLTTVHAPFDKMGRTAVRLLVGLADGQPAPSHGLVQIDVELIVRRSCGSTEVRV